MAISIPVPHGPDIDVWMVNLADETNGSAADVALLSDEEAARAMRFRSRDHYHRFVRRRIALRRLVSAYCDVTADGFDYELAEFGKLALPSYLGQICLNGSHSRDMAVIAICDHPVGIDLEAINAEKEIPGLISVVCTQTESRWLERMAGDARIQSFFRIWALKEAIVKLSGAGLTADLGQIETNLHDPALSPRCYGEPLDAVELPIASGFCGALAVHASETPPRLKVQDFNSEMFR